MQHLLAHLSSLPGCVRPPELLTGSLLPSPFRSARTSPAKWQSLPDFHLEMAPQVPAVVSVVRGQIATVLQLLPVPTAEPRCACSSARSPALPLLPAPLCFLRGILPLIPVCQVSIQWGPGLSWALQSVIHHEIAWTYPPLSSSPKLTNLFLLWSIPAPGCRWGSCSSCLAAEGREGHRDGCQGWRIFSMATSC